TRPRALGPDSHLSVASGTYEPVRVRSRAPDSVGLRWLPTRSSEQPRTSTSLWTLTWRHGESKAKGTGIPSRLDPRQSRHPETGCGTRIFPAVLSRGAVGEDSG